MDRKQHRVQETKKNKTASIPSLNVAISHYNQGLKLQATEHTQEALQEFDIAISINPAFAEAYCDRGLALHALQRFDDALASYGKAIELRPDYFPAYNNKGNALQELKRYPEALASFDKAIALNPAFAVIHYNRGNALKEMKCYAQALISYDKAIALQSDYADAYYNRGFVLYAMRRYEDALANYDRLIALKPDCAKAFGDRGNVLKELQRYDAALASYDKAISLKPGYGKAYNNRGVLLHEQHRYEEALENFEKAIALNPDDAEGWWNKSQAKLLQGEYAEGWKMYEWRWKRKNQTILRIFQKPLWLGGIVNGDETILIDVEQGFGDTLQFCRYISLVAKQNKVIFECYPSLVPLMQYSFPEVQVVALAQDYPGTAGLPHYDYHTPLLSLPYVFDTTLETVPPAPYVRAQPEYIEKWRKIANQELRKKEKPLNIGLCWAGGQRPDQPDALSVDVRRSLHFNHIKPLLDIKGINFISLQLGPPKLQIDDLRIKDFSSHIENWSDTAGLISHLDLVISADTAVCHLAAAMGKNTLLLNRYDTCWRWLLNRDDSPWYPTLTQFRQTTPGDWEGVIKPVKKLLILQTNKK